MKLLSTSEIIEKKSKFLGFYYHIDSIEEIKTIVNSLKEAHKKANHFVYAYKYKNTAGKTDDKEPNGTAGGQIYNLMELNDIKDSLIVVVRYYGGTKLGAGLLSRTYKNAALITINKIKSNS